MSTNTTTDIPTASTLPPGDGLTPWASLTRADLLSKPLADLIRMFGVTVEETDEIGNMGTVVLGGEPGRMLLQVHPSMPQQAREDETRAALLTWFESEARLHQPLDGQAAEPDSDARKHTDDNAAHLLVLRAECERLGYGLQLTDDPHDDLPAVLTVNGRPTCVVRADELGAALDEVRAIGRCVDCRSILDDTTGVYAGGYHLMDGSPLLICPPCRDERVRLAASPDRQAFDRALAAIEAAFKASPIPERTRRALAAFVDMTAAEAPAGGVR